MFYNNLKIAFRSLSSNRIFSLVNIAGLSIGMAATMIIFLWVQNEFSYDTYHPN